MDTVGLLAPTKKIEEFSMRIKFQYLDINQGASELQKASADF
jgi:hypothetical protein